MLAAAAAAAAHGLAVRLCDREQPRRATTCLESLCALALLFYLSRTIKEQQHCPYTLTSCGLGSGHGAGAAPLSDRGGDRGERGVKTDAEGGFDPKLKGLLAFFDKEWTITKREVFEAEFGLLARLRFKLHAAVRARALTTG